MKKFKEIAKKYLIGFVIGIITGGVVNVIAVTYFPSNEVSYDNSSSELKSTNVKGAIDELYNVCKGIITVGGQDIETVTTGDGLYKDEYENRYFYRGKNPNNYIMFNGKLFRIISIEGDGIIKIMRYSDIQNQVWDSSGSNNWANASINKYLNGTYYNSLNSVAQSQIVSHDWSIGEVTDVNNDLADQINDENSSKWNGKVALVTMSEYIRSNSNQSSCGTFMKYYSNQSCVNTGWMDTTVIEYWWTLSPAVGTTAGGVFNVKSNPHYFPNYPTNFTDKEVRPVVYLNSNVVLNGRGTSLDPYGIMLSTGQF